MLSDVVFPCNKFTRRKADSRGSQLYLPGLIKAFATNFSFKKFYCSRTAGGRREYNVAIVIDVSNSMQGSFEDGTLLAFATLMSALTLTGIEQVSVVLFGSKVRIVKTATMAWDPASILLFMHSAVSDATMGTNDAAGIHCAVDLLGEVTAKGPRKVFVLTDGFSSCGLELVRALVRADRESIDVLALCVGVDHSGVSKLYRRWMTVATAAALPLAFRAFYEQEVLGTSAAAEQHQPDHFFKLVQEARQAAREVEGTCSSSIEQLLKQDWHEGMTGVSTSLQQLLNQRQGVKLTEGCMTMTVDVCFVVDCTGSMQPWMASVKVRLADMSQCTAATAIQHVASCKNCSVQ